MDRPKVSVLMSVYNGERYLRESVESILNQNFSHFEFVIVDDGSTDSTSEILENYARQDKRLRLVANASNLGLTRSLNRGLELACGEYVARQDADDVSAPERLISQVRFLEDHPEIGVVGSWITNIDEAGQQEAYKNPTCPVLIGWTLLFSNCMAHPSIMLRRSLVDEGVFYRPEISYGQDYELWVRLSSQTRLANIPRCLCLRRRHERAISTRYHQDQVETEKTIVHENVAGLLREEIPHGLTTWLWAATSGEVLESVILLREVTHLYVRLYRAYVERKVLNRAESRVVGCDLSRRLTRIGLNHVGRWPIDAMHILWKGILLRRGIPFNTYAEELLKFAKAYKLQDRT
jgi:glycosyltransferase involved in cell wall biosynthesis